MIENNLKLEKFVDIPLSEEKKAIENLHMKELEEAYNQYDAELRNLYKKLIELEYDYHRRFLLTSCLDSLNEDNK